MATNLYLPEKKEREIQHHLTGAQTLNWIAPNKNRDGSSYKIRMLIWGAGGGSGYEGAEEIPAYAGGNGGHIICDVTVTPNVTYEIVIGNNGVNTGFDSSGTSATVTTFGEVGSVLIQVDGGGGGLDLSGSGVNGTNGVVTINNGTLVDTIYQESFGDRVYRAKSGNYLSESYVATRTGQGGLGGVDNESNLSGTDGKVIMRYSLKEDIIDNVPS